MSRSQPISDLPGDAGPARTPRSAGVDDGSTAPVLAVDPHSKPAAAAPRYWAFISYSHRDEGWASWLHSRLETYTGHKRLVGTRNRYDEPVPARPFPVFRDRDELEGAPDLPDRIHDALRLARFLIVICSPAAAGSKWVNEEIKAFKALGREDRVLAIIVDGEPNADEQAGEQECFPPALKFRVGADGELADERTEPLAADARKNGDGKRSALLKLLAAILGVQFDELKQRDLERQRRFWMRIGVAATAGVLVLLGLTIFAFTQRNEAVRQREIAEQRARDAISRQLDSPWHQDGQRRDAMARRASSGGVQAYQCLRGRAIRATLTARRRHVSAGRSQHQSGGHAGVVGPVEKHR